MIQAPERRSRFEECNLNSIFGTFKGHRIYASRKVAEKDLFPCGDRDESRFSLDFEIPLSILGMAVAGDPNFPSDISCVQVLNERMQRFEGPEKIVLADLLKFIKVHDPDVILFPYADTWVPLIVMKARRYGLEPTFSRSVRLKQMASKYHHHFDTPRLCGLNI